MQRNNIFYKIKDEIFYGQPPDSNFEILELISKRNNKLDNYQIVYSLYLLIHDGRKNDAIRLLINQAYCKQDEAAEFINKNYSFQEALQKIDNEMIFKTPANIKKAKKTGKILMIYLISSIAGIIYLIVTFFKK